MLIRRLIPCALLIALAVSSPLIAQRQQSVINTARERARVPYDAGLAQLRAEDFSAAVKSFQAAIDLDASFDMAYYMLGRTHMAVRNYVAATVALSRCRELHVSESSRRFADKLEYERYRREKANELNERIGQLKAIFPPTPPILEEIRQLQERKRQIDDADRQLSAEQVVPAYVSLALGSAYFRSGKLQEAEQAYLATVAADAKVGEAHNNLAVVYMETGRLDQAEKSVKAAEKTGLKVQQALKDEIQKRKKAGS
jgi:Tfp pilus assembly protein PilF